MYRGGVEGGSEGSQKVQRADKNGGEEWSCNVVWAEGDKDGCRVLDLGVVMVVVVA